MANESARDSKVTFALFFGNRGFFPASLMTARAEGAAAGGQGRRLRFDHDGGIGHALRRGGDAGGRGEVRRVPQAQRGKFDGVILSLPNFGDETGAITALKECGVPILIQAYPDELDKMVAGAAARLVLREVLGHGRVPPERAAVHRAEAAHGLAAGRRRSPRNWTISRGSAAW